MTEEAEKAAEAQELEVVTEMVTEEVIESIVMGAREVIQESGDRGSRSGGLGSKLQFNKLAFPTLLEEHSHKQVRRELEDSNQI